MSGPVAHEKVVLLVYDCLPNAGSDPGIGWQAVANASARHHVLAVTKASNRQSIEAAGPLPNVTWYYVDVPESMGLLHTGTSFGDAVHNVFWLRKAKTLVTKLLSTERIALTHYVTFSAYWMPVPFSDIGVPHVFGPVSGGESEPKELRTGQTITERAKERIRLLLQRTATRSPSWQRMANSPTTLMVAATEATAERMRDAGAKRVEVWRTGFSLTRDLLDELAKIERTRNISEEPVLATSGRQLRWKGHDLAIDAFALVAARRPGARLIVIGNGPQQKTLRRQAERCGLVDKIDFLANATRATERALIANSDAFVFPSRRDSGSTLLPLAQILGVPIVAFDTGAVRQMTGGHAMLANLAHDRTPAEALAEQILELLGDTDKRAALVEAGRNSAAVVFGEESAKEAIEYWYGQVAA